MRKKLLLAAALYTLGFAALSWLAWPQPVLHEGMTSSEVAEALGGVWPSIFPDGTTILRPGDGTETMYYVTDPGKLG
jgi:hypothetical protein